MTPVKIILILLLLLALRAFLVQKSLVLIQRILGFFMFVGLVFFVLFPNVTTKIANAVGVGQGRDLVFYLSHLFLLLLIIILWRRSRDLMETVTRLSRTIAVHHPLRMGEQETQEDRPLSGEI